MKRIRLDKFLSEQTAVSRADAKKLLRAGAVRVNGAPCRDAGFLLDAETDRVEAQGKEIVYREHLYVMMNKPAGVISASDTGREDAPIVLDLLPPALRRPGLFPAGRLDKDTTGFVLITDDGAFAHRILSPGRHVPKTYHLRLRDPLDPAVPALFSAGFQLDGELLQPAPLRPVSEDGLYEIVLREGRYHQIKRMFAAVGNRVVELRRVAIGGVALDPTLAPGECRLLTAREMEALGAGK